MCEFVAALKKLAADCNFGTSMTPVQEGGSTATPANTPMLPLDVMLRDRFVCGLRDEGLQQRLFAETGLTFSKAYDIAQRAESAGHQQRDIRRNVEPVHHTSQHSGQSTTTANSRKNSALLAMRRHARSPGMSIQDSYMQILPKTGAH